MSESKFQRELGPSIVISRITGLADRYKARASQEGKRRQNYVRIREWQSIAVADDRRLTDMDADKVGEQSRWRQLSNYGNDYILGMGLALSNGYLEKHSPL